MTDKRPLRPLFVCSANVCRSPMAAGIADRVALELGLEVEIRSAGTLGFEGRPAAPAAISVCRELGIDLQDHRSQALTEALVRWADRILVMEPEHAVAARTLAPELAEDGVVVLGSYVGKPAIADPTGSWFSWAHRRTRDELLTAVRHALAPRAERG